MSFLSFSLIFCKRAVAAAFILASLLCNTWYFNPRSAQAAEILNELSPLDKAIFRSAQARAAWKVYNVTSDATRTVTPGEYLSIDVQSFPAKRTLPAAIIDAGDVTLKGGSGSLFNIPTSKSSVGVQIGSTANPAALRLEQGDATGNISLAGGENYKDASLLIGTGEAADPAGSVIIKGNINGPGRTNIMNYPQADSVIETQGANLVVQGQISGNRVNGMVKSVNAFNGNITANKYIYAWTANAKSGFHIGTESAMTAAAVNIENDAYIHSVDRMDILYAIGDTASPAGGGIMAPGSRLESDRSIVLQNGVKEAAGTIKANSNKYTNNMILAHTPGAIEVEAPMADILQGGSAPLTLDSGNDIMARDINVDTIMAKADIISGSYTFPDTSSTVNMTDSMPDRYFVAARGDGYFFPRNTITANTLSIGNRLLAGEINLPRDADTDANVTAANMWVMKNNAANGLAASSGDFTLDNGSLTLTSPKNIIMKKWGATGHTTIDVEQEYASIVDGNFKITKNQNSSFTTLKVGEKASVAGGALSGTTLVANAADFTGVTSLNIADTLDIAENLTIADNGEAEVKHNKVGGKAEISGGSYKGADLTAGSADFSGVTALEITDKITVTGDLGVGNSGQSNVASATVGGAAKISGGSYSGASLSANSASFSNVEKINITDNLTVNSSLVLTDSSVNSIKSAEVKNGPVTMTGGSYGGESLKAASAVFTDISGVNLGVKLDLTGDLSLKSSGDSNIASAAIGGDAAISGGSYTGNSLNAASASFQGVSSIALGELTASGGNGEFTDSSAQITSAVISGDLAMSNSSVNVQNLEVSKNLTIKSGYLTAAAAKASSAAFTDGTTAEFDDLTLTSDDLSLAIDKGATVFINNELSDLKGIEAIQDGKLIIRNHNDAQTSIPEIYIGRDTSLTHEAGIYNLSKGLYGGDEEGAASDADFARLIAGEIEITNTNLSLGGIGSFANEVKGDLILHHNGDSRLGDISVGGKAQVDGGSLQARDLDVKGNANFENVKLTLLGVDNNASSIGGDLTIKAGDEESSLGDISVTGSSSISGGKLTAGAFAAARAAFSGAVYANIQSLKINSGDGTLNIGAADEAASSVSVNNAELNGAPLTVYGESSFEVRDGGENNGNLTAGEINLPQNGVISVFGDLVADSAALGQDGGTIAGASVTIASQLDEMKGGAITATDGDVVLQKGAKDGRGEINANNNIVSGAENILADISGKGLNLTAEIGGISAGSITVNNLSAGANIDANAISASKITAGGNINASDIKADELKAGGDVKVAAGSLNLAKTGDIGGSLEVAANKTSEFADLSVAGSSDFTGGEVIGANLTTGSANFVDSIKANIDAIVINGGALTVGKGSEDASTVSASALTMNNEGTITINGESGLEITGDDENPGNLTAGAINIPQNGKITAAGAITADTAALGQYGASLTGSDVSIAQTLTEMKGGSVTASAGGVNLAGGIKDGKGSVNAKTSVIAGLGGGYQDLTGDELNLSAETGDIRASAIRAASITAGQDIDSEDLSANELKAGRNALIRDGSLKLANKSSIGGNLDIPNNKDSSFTTLDVSKAVNVTGGSLTSGQLTAGDANLTDLTAAFNELTLKEAGHAITVKSGSAASSVSVDSLALNGGSMNLSSSGDSQAGMYVEKFSASTNANAIDGNIGVSKNSMLILGSKNGDLLTAPAAISTNGLAAFVLAQPMRLNSGYGIHVTGVGASSPSSGSIKFDAGSLFVMDSAKAKAIYAYLGLTSLVPSAQLSENKGAQGALSAEKGNVIASVGLGSQIYIRNPQSNTVVVALGENITTNYADKTSRADSGDAPWTGDNLKYDNSDKVKIKRLENEYAGQFLVVPVESEFPELPDTNNPSTPSNPSDTDNPSTPDTPSTPNNPSTPSDNPSTPDTPSTPSNPSTPSDTPSKPNNPSAPSDTPSTPANPATPDTPFAPDNPDQPEPDKPGPSKPDKPSSPHPSQTHPNAHPGIHDVIKDGQDKDNIGTEPRHLVKHNGAGFISHTLTHDNPHEATRLLESSARMIVLGAVPQMALSTNDAAHSAISQRIGVDNMGISPDEIRARSFALWAVPLYRSVNAWELEAGAHDYNYHAGLGGVAIGADVTYEDIIRAGIAFNIGGGYAKSGGNLKETTNNMDFWGLGAYAGLAYGNFGVSVDVNYTSTYNKLKQDVSSLPGWQELKTDATAWALSASLDLEYRIATDWLDVIPHAGFKYNFIHVNDYDITNQGNTIIKGSTFNQNIWTFPTGVRLSKNFSLDNGWLIKPMLDFRVTPAAGDIDAKTTVRFTGVDTDLDLQTKTMDYVTFGGSAGLEAKIGDFALGVSYSLSAGERSVINAVFGTFRYEF